MLLNGLALLRAAPIKNMAATKCRSHDVSYGLGEAGYDIRIKQAVRFLPSMNTVLVSGGTITEHKQGRFVIASAVEEFEMPNYLTGVVHDKSTWARRGLSVFNTVIEPGWKGFLTLELVYHGNQELTIPAGAGIAQVLFHQMEENAQYSGRYQDQADTPVAAIPMTDTP